MQLANSNIRVRFVDTLGPTPPGNIDDETDQSFTFTETDFRQPDCTGSFLTVSGNGTFTPSGGAAENAQFFLILSDTSADLTITNSTRTVSMTPSEATNPGLEAEIEDCDRF